MTIDTAPGPCGACGATAWSVSYAGPVRDGTFGREKPGTVFSCGSCGVEFLPAPPEVAAGYYETGEYRTSVGEAAEPEDFFARHDAEQWRRFGFLESLSVRGRRIVDVGCGGGSFLDGLKGFAAETIAIEPTRAYHESLRGRGHAVYADLDTALIELDGRADIVVSFSVVEHVPDPARFMSDIRRLLAREGTALISTPNRADILLAIGCEAYRRFFYRAVHRYYFDRRSLERLAARAGFHSCEVVFCHRFNFGNFVTWLDRQRPGGAAGTTPLGNAFDRLWRATVEETGHADYLYAYLRR
jgi:2-polyprenyl-3-methyl-5-hydroxy-6-metoxy-1,4-benzoquinol methylase